jgi:hypothetical protein
MWLCGHKIAPEGTMAPRVNGLVKFFRSNPQALALLIVCLILGLGTFLVVIFGLVSAGSSTTNGEPSGAIVALRSVERSRLTDA